MWNRLLESCFALKYSHETVITKRLRAAFSLQLYYWKWFISMEELQLNYLLGFFFACLLWVILVIQWQQEQQHIHWGRETLASHFKVHHYVENKGSQTRSLWSPHTALPCTAGGRQKSMPHLFTCFFSDLIWPGLFFSKSCFLHACWGRRTDFPAGSLTLKRGSRKVLWISKHVQFDCNIGKSIYSETVQNLHPHNVAQVWVGCRELVQAGSWGFMASTWNFYLNKRSQGPGRSVPFQSTTHRGWGQLKKPHFLIYVH